MQLALYALGLGIMGSLGELEEHAFISYVREDSRGVDALQRMLETAGIRVWRDTSDLWPGEDWRARIRDAINREALVFIACFSRRSIARKSSYQNEELALAIEQMRLRSPDIPWLIPVRFDDCTIPDRDIGSGRMLSSLQCADIFGDSRDEAASRLITSVLRIFGQKQSASAPVARSSDPEKLAAKRMRMLRLYKGWSAEKLSQEYETVVGGSLTRATIAKIESDRRHIKAGEVEGVARVFDLISADLLDPNGPRVVLCYAEQDGITGQEIAGWLEDHGFRVLSTGPAMDHLDLSPGEGHAIGSAQAFVVLLSPSFLSSPQCRQDLNLVIRREQQLLSPDLIDTGFIYVLRVAETPDLDGSGLEPYPLLDLTRARDWSREVALSKLGGGIISSAHVTAAWTPPLINLQTRQAFLDRGEELERVFYGLSNRASHHFWLVISPPGLGKSWFLEQLVARAESASAGWVTSMIDLRLDPAGREHDAMMVIGSLFGVEQPQSSGHEDELLGIARKIIRTGRPWLCLLDSAELLPANAVAQLRHHLGKIDRLIQDTRSAVCLF
jgi:transcriptional regulator with XRE-family HTH domain